MASNRLPRTPTNLSVDGLMPILFKGEDKRCKFLSHYSNVNKERYFGRYFEQASQKGKVEIAYDRNSAADKNLMELMDHKAEQILDEIDFIVDKSGDGTYNGIAPEFYDYLSENKIRRVYPIGAIITGNGDILLLHEGCA